MERLYLKFPTIEDKNNVLEFKREFVESGQKMAGVGGLNKIENYEEWLEKINKDLYWGNCEEGQVPATVYLTYRLSDNKLVGMLQIRHVLNDYLLHFGGHIGDCVRPSEQGRGYATEQISLALKKCEEMGMERVLIVCFKKNIASARSIQKNNGKLENVILDKGEEKERYWIELKDSQKK